MSSSQWDKEASLEQASIRTRFVTETMALPKGVSPEQVFVFCVCIQDGEAVTLVHGPQVAAAAKAWISVQLRSVFSAIEISFEHTVFAIRDDCFAIGCRVPAQQASPLGGLYQGAKQLAADLCFRLTASVVTKDFVVAGLAVPLTVAVGAALAAQDCGHQSMLETLSQADHAAQRARFASVLQSPVFDMAEELLLARQKRAIRLVQTAIQKGLVRIHYQPKVDLASCKLVGVEALVRIISQAGPGRLIYPDEFIPHIEGTSAMDELGIHIFKTVLSDLERWAGRGLKMQASINVASSQLSSGGLAAQVLALLASHPSVTPDQVILEVLETRALGDMEVAVAELRLLDEQGIKSQLDDFGTGFSTFAYLKLLPVSALKIDGSFVSKILTNDQDEAIVRSCIAIARVFGIDVIAEGVETKAIADKLVEWGCPTIQGYLISRPIPFESVESWCETDGSSFGVSETSVKTRKPLRRMR